MGSKNVLILSSALYYIDTGLMKESSLDRSVWLLKEPLLRWLQRDQGVSHFLAAFSVFLLLNDLLVNWVNLFSVDMSEKASATPSNFESDKPTSY